MGSMRREVTLVGAYAGSAIDAAFVPSKHQWLNRPETLGTGLAGSRT